MDNPVLLDNMFKPLISHTQEAVKNYGASAASVIVIQDNQITTEWYSGKHHFKSGALQVNADSMFNLYSVRKTYVGLATAIAVIKSRVSIDTKVADIITDMPESDLNGITIRDLAAKTSVKYFGAARMEREEVASRLIKEMTGSTIAKLITECVFKPLELSNTQWVSAPHSRLVCDFQAADGYASIRIESDEGHERNLYASARDLAYWGNLHLHQGLNHNKRIVPLEVFQLVEQLREDTADRNRIFGWYYQKNGYYATGAAGCHCVIVPELNAVAVRMLNKYTHNYAEDQVSFNETFYKCLQS
ncbi:serine hydrolase domain-containing protein [Paenibacillus sp. TC-CSREp1]|uniref:serine hydrolase domain-containing protein n=1 Tax=Paenibacillus sp. TC-CSREp1 TaxID=3410089 RepID=UPI003CE84664